MVKSNTQQKNIPSDNLEQITIYLLRNLDNGKFYCNYAKRKGKVFSQDNWWTNDIHKCTKWFTHQGPVCAKAFVNKACDKRYSHYIQESAPNMKICTLVILIDITENEIKSSIYPQKTTYEKGDCYEH